MPTFKVGPTSRWLLTFKVKGASPIEKEDPTLSWFCIFILITVNMNIIKIFLQFLTFFYCFFIRCEEHIKIYDDINKYFSSYWVNYISNERDTILVNMEKENPDLDDYNSTFSCEREFIYKGNNYKLKITVSKNHNLEYEILIKDGGGFRDTNDDEKKIFYRLNEYDENYNIKGPLKTMKSLFDSKNWVLIRVKTKDNKEFYAFINNIGVYSDGSHGWGPLAYGSDFKELYIIYSNIISIHWLTNTVAQTYYDFIDLKGLNFEDNDNVYLSNWFKNAKSLKKFKNIPNFINGIDISSMLDGCESLEDVDLGENTISHASNCFENCSKLKNVNLKNVKIAENANLSKMFLNCKNIKNIEGFKTFIKEKDNPNIENMLEGSEVDGELDLTSWGTNIIPKEMLKNGKVKSLKLFNLKKILQYYIEFCKKEIQKYEKEINDGEKYLEDYKKELEELNQKEAKTEDDEKDIEDLKEIIQTTEDLIKKQKDMIKQYKDEINGKGKGLNILENSTVDELYINEEFIPEDKKDLDMLVGNNCITKMIYIIDKDGKCKKYKDFNDYKNNKEYKEPEQQDIPINPQIPEDIKENEIPKGNTCINCCGKCFKSCCCCCHKNSNRKRSNSI